MNRAPSLPRNQAARSGMSQSANFDAAVAQFSVNRFQTINQPG
jgi:hypothetical protein